MLNVMPNQQDMAFLCIDLQERLMPAIEARDEVLRNSGILLRSAAELEIPVVISEQNPKGLGKTVPEIAAAAGPKAVYAEKTSFSFAQDANCLAALAATGKRQLAIFGVEAHVCVVQTVLQMIGTGSGHTIFVVADAVGSRKNSHRDLALSRIAWAGAVVMPAESLLFEMLRDSKHPKFKAIAGLVK